jgi:hypothetical protein
MSGRGSWLRGPIKPIRASVFGLVIICFFLPFVVVTCPGNPDTKITGIQLSFGSDLKSNQISPGLVDRHIDMEPFAVLALACAVVGLVFCFMKRGLDLLFGAASGIAGLVLLYLLQSKIFDSAKKMASDFVKVSLGYGLWLAAAGFGVSLLLILVALLYAKRR